VEPAWLDGREVGLLAGIARPAGFRRTLEALGARIASERLFPDHHRYRARDLRGLSARAPLWITTEKDAVKILPSWTEGIDLRMLTVELVAPDGAAWIDWIEQALAGLRPAPGR
jgi:tetraacyldisaccharide 4'-kinase